MKRPVKVVTMNLFFVAVVALFVYVFYASELRERCENRLYDLRTRLAPALVPSSPVILLTMDDDTAASINTMPPLRPWDTGKSDELSIPTLLQIVRTAAATKARMIAVVMPPQVFNYDDPELDPLAVMAQNDKRIFLGTFGQSTTGDGERTRPSRLVLTAADRLFKADIKRDFRREIVRRMIIQEPSEMPYLLSGMMEKLKPEAAQELASSNRSETLSFELNYAYKNQFAQLPATILVSNSEAIDLNDAIVLIGFTSYRPFTFDEREATFVNTPWQPDGEDVATGSPLIDVQAIGLLNLLEGTWLRPAPLWINVAQTVLISTLAMIVWSFNITIACLIFAVGWLGLLWAHSLVFSYLNLHVPLADTAMWSSLATLSGAFWRLRFEAIWRSDQIEKLRTDEELVQVQDQFLSRFAAELLSMNDRLISELNHMDTELVGTAATAHARALSSAEELREYLTGMRQVGYLNRNDAVKPTLQDVAVGEVVVDILRLFESKAHDAKVSFLVSLTPAAMVLADRTLVAQILYNLIGNAIKYSPPGSQITVEALRYKNQVMMRVKDQGPGIAPEFQERIFEKFYRVKDDFVYKSKGHGLGLYLSRYFAQQMGADISVSSTVGEGACFVLALRAAVKKTSDKSRVKHKPE